VRAPRDVELVVSAVEEARARWLRYRDGVARAMGVSVEPSPPR
jgi:hypothetical protein